MAGHHAGLRMVMLEQTIDASTRGLRASMTQRLGLVGFEVGFGGAAVGADPGIWNILEGSAGSDARVGIAFGGVVDVPTDCATVFFGHSCLPK